MTPDELKNKKMAEVIEKMKRQKAIWEEQSRLRGRKAGENWMLSGKCTYSQAKFLEHCSIHDKFDFSTGEVGLQFLAEIILDDEDVHILHQSTIDEMENAGIPREDLANEAFLDGFVQGALDLWGEIKHKI